MAAYAPVSVYLGSITWPMETRGRPMTGQIAAALVLLIGAGRLLRTFCVLPGIGGTICCSRT
jgi:hypothetical protein